jgi:hypothetical protein
VSANVQPSDGLLGLVSAYRALCREKARRSFVCLSRDAWVVENKDEPLAEWYPEMAERHTNLKSIGLTDSATVGAEKSLDAFVRDRAIAGAPRECIKQIARWRERTGCEALLLLLNKKASFKQLRSTIKLFGEEVLPASRMAALNQQEVFAFFSKRNAFLLFWCKTLASKLVTRRENSPVRLVAELPLMLPEMTRKAAP